MTDRKQTSQNQQANLEGIPPSDVTQSNDVSDKVLLRVEGQNENITTPPEEVQAEIAAVVRELEDSTMGIEDES